MGKDWLYWVGGGGLGKSSARNMPGEMRDAAATSGGCMRAVFQLFDFPLNRHNSNLSNSNFLPEEDKPTASDKGLEAPRNSLDLESSHKEENNFNLPVGIHIKTRHAKASSRTVDFSSESSNNSPAMRTPSVVARLMGLDLLPECNSPGSNSSIKACHHQRKLRSHRPFFEDDISLSLPETPRMSSASRRSDFEHHRLSLKENINEEPSFSRGRRFRFRSNSQNENASPTDHAKQIVKQVKLSVTRKVGLDITNASRRDENLIPLKPTNKNSNPKISSTETANNNKHTTTSPRVSTSDNTNQTQRSVLIPLQEQQHKDSKKIANSGLKKLPFQAIRKKKEETFVHPTERTKAVKKSKKTPLSSDVSPTLLQAKKQLSNKPSHSYNRADNGLTVKENVLPESNNGHVTAVRGEATAEYGNYIERILKLAGVVNNSTALTSVKWHTRSHPIDPLIFHRIELFHLNATAAAAGKPADLRHRCNRKLIFQVVDELLADILKPYFGFKPRISSICAANRGFPLVEELCRKIDSFPAANCVVLEDIDSLIDKDLSEFKLNVDFEEERETITREIEGEIVERLVRETVAMVGRPHGGGGGAEKRWRMSRAGLHVR